MPNGEILKVDNAAPLDNDVGITSLLAPFLNDFMFQLGYRRFNRDLIPMVSISKDELQPILDFISNMRLEKGEDPALSIEILGEEDPEEEEEEEEE